MNVTLQNTLRGIIWLAAGIALSNGLQAEDVMLENDCYQIRWTEASQQLTIIGKGVDHCRITALTVPEATESIETHPETSASFGPGETLVLRHRDGSTTRFGLYERLPLVAVQRSVANRSNALRTIDKLPVLSATLEFDLQPVEQLVARGTAGLTKVERRFGSYVFGAVADPQSRAGVVFGWATNRRGQGIVFPGRDDGRATLSTRVDYGDLRLPAGTDEKGELLLIGVCGDVREGLEQYAEATAKHLDIHLRPLPCVYCTWYHAGASDEKRLARNTEFASRQLKPWGLTVMQIDDLWQPGLSINGPKRIFDRHDPDGPYPSGMKAMADTIKSQGMVPGIWFMPFAGTWLDPYFADKQDIFYKVGAGDPAITKSEMEKHGYQTDRPISELPYSTSWAGTAIDCSNPAAQAYLRQMVDRIAHQWGYEYFKMDGFHTGSGSKQKYVDNQYQEDDLGKTVRHNPMMTPIEGYQKGMSIIREAAGEDVFFLGCCQVQNLRSFGTTFGFLDAMRVGPDNGTEWSGHDRGPRYGGRYYFLHRRVWHCDPDPFYVRPSLTYDQAITLASYVALSGQLAASSYDYYALPPERLDIIRRVMPTHQVTSSRPLDFLRRDVPHEWLLTDRSSGPRRIVVGQFNWSAGDPVALSTSLEDLGLDPKHRYVGFDYWANEFVASFTGALSCELQPGTCRVISVYPEADYPQLVSTSRHITQGIVDVLTEQWDAEQRALSGISQVVANDPYELRIVVPAVGQGWKATGAEIVQGDDNAVVTVSQDEGGVRVKLESSRGGQLGWRLHFQPAGE